jgi:hypothetical protein
MIDVEYETEVQLLPNTINYKPMKFCCLYVNGCSGLWGRFLSFPSLLNVDICKCCAQHMIQWTGMKI